MKLNQPILITAFILCSIVIGFSQKTFTKALGYPEKFTPAIDVPAAEMILYLTKPSVYSKSDPWIVFSDRDDNQTFDKANGKPFKKLGFKDVFYVVSEVPGWVEIVKGTADGLKLIKEQKYMGWISMDKLLLWNESLIDQKTF